jgi:hypothetical protein
VFGRAIAQAVSSWLPTAAALVRAQLGSCGICGGQSGTGAGFLLLLLFPMPILIPPTSPHSSIIRGPYNRPKSCRRAKWVQSHPPPRNKKKSVSTLSFHLKLAFSSRIPWKCVLLEKQKFPQTFKKFPAFCGYTHYWTLSWASSIQSKPSRLTSLRSTIILILKSTKSQDSNGNLNSFSCSDELQISCGKLCRDHCILEKLICLNGKKFEVHGTQKPDSLRPDS